MVTLLDKSPLSKKSPISSKTLIKSRSESGRFKKITINGNSPALKDTSKKLLDQRQASINNIAATISSVKALQRAKTKDAVYDVHTTKKLEFTQTAKVYNQHAGDDPQRQTSIRWDEASIEKNLTQSLLDLPKTNAVQQLPIHQKDTPAPENGLNTSRHSINGSVSCLSTSQIKTVAVAKVSPGKRSRGNSVRKGLSVNIGFTSKGQLSKELQEFQNFITSEMKKIFAKVDSGPFNSLVKSSKTFEKRKLMDHIEEKYRENAGSLVLAKGVIEHIFQARRPGGHRKKLEKEVITLEDLVIYLTEYLLTEDKQRQLETAFSLYLYISRSKIYHVGAATGQSGSNAEVSMSQSSAAGVVNHSGTKSIRNKSQSAAQLFTIREAGGESFRRNAQKVSSPTGSSVSTRKTSNFQRRASKMSINDN